MSPTCRVPRCFASLEAVPTAGWLKIMLLTHMLETGLCFASEAQPDGAEAGDIALDPWVPSRSVCRAASRQLAEQ